MGEWAFRHRHWAPYLLLAPGLLWLAVFYAFPAFQMFLASLSVGTIETGFTFTFQVSNYTDSLTRYSDQFIRSLAYGLAATIIAFLIAFPLAYAIAFRAGRYRNLMLFLVIAPFFTSFLLRTLSWKIILSDNGMIVGVLKDLGVVPEDFRLLATPAAVVAGITYNFLPFMTLPLYVALEKVDRRLVEAAEDLYAGPWRPGGTIVGILVGAGLVGVLTWIFEWSVPAGVVLGGVVGGLVGTLFVSQSFLWVILPLSLPGVFAGSLLTFIPAVGDYVNAELLGTPTAQMIGNVIQSRFLKVNDIPTASALSFTLMAMILIAVFIYARVLGTEDLTGGAV
jgi:spermidine/putrescine transport system permease protein